MNINSQVAISHRYDSQIPHILPFTKTDNVLHWNDIRKRGGADINFFYNFMSANFLLMEEHVEANNPIGRVNIEFTMMAFVGAINLKIKEQKSPAMKVQHTT